MGLYRHFTFAIFLKYDVFFKVIFIEYYPSIIMENKFVNILINLVKLPHTSPYLLSSFIFSVMTSKCNFSGTFIFLWISKQTDFVQSWQLNISYIISQFVNVWVDKPLFVSELMYLSDSFWTFLKICIHSFINPFPLSSFKGVKSFMSTKTIFCYQ